MADKDKPATPPPPPPQEPPRPQGESLSIQSQQMGIGNREPAADDKRRK